MPKLFHPITKISSFCRCFFFFFESVCTVRSSMEIEIFFPPTRIFIFYRFFFYVIIITYVRAQRGLVSSCGNLDLIANIFRVLPDDGNKWSKTTCGSSSLCSETVSSIIENIIMASSRIGARHPAVQAYSVEIIKRYENKLTRKPLNRFGSLLRGCTSTIGRASHARGRL